MHDNRRSFLKQAGRAALGLGCGLPLMGSGCNALKEGPLSSSQWALIIDTKKCLQDDVRQACADACHLEHKVPFIHMADDAETVDPKREIKWIWSEEFQHAFPDQVHAGTGDARREMPVLVACNHCSRPPCTKVCPTGATWKRESDGLVMMDMHRCIGCRYCMAACPYGSRSFNWYDPRDFLEETDESGSDYPTRGKGVVEKCTFCAEKIRGADEGEDPVPACVKAANAAQEGAMAFGKLGDEKIQKILDEHRTVCRRIGLGTGPNVYYIV